MALYLNRTKSAPVLRIVKVRPGRVRGLSAARLAEAVAAATTGTDGFEREALVRLAARAATLAGRSRGLRGWTGR